MSSRYGLWADDQITSPLRSTAPPCHLLLFWMKDHRSDRRSVPTESSIQPGMIKSRHSYH